MKQYRNAERTKKWIRHAFVELLAEKKTIDKITVNELAEKADITKTTFYYHYADIYAVAEELENELIENLNEVLNEIVIENSTDFSKYVNKIMSFIKENEDNYRLVSNTADLNYFATKLKNIFSKKIASLATSWGFSENYEKRTVQVYFLVSACVDTMIQFLKGELVTSMDLVSDVVIEAIEKLKK